MTDAELDVGAADIKDEDLAQIRAQANAIVILPLRRAADGTGVYSRSSLFLVKELRSDGLDAAYLDPPELRSFEVLESAVTTDLISMAIGGGSGVLTNTVWAGVQQFFARRRTARAEDGQVQLTIVDVSEAGGRRISVCGNREDVVTLVERLDLDGRLNPSPPGAALDEQIETQDDGGRDDL